MLMQSSYLIKKTPTKNKCQLFNWKGNNCTILIDDILIDDIDFSLIILQRWLVSHMMRRAIRRGIERLFCTSNRDGNASENNSRRQWRGATLRSVWLIELFLRLKMNFIVRPWRGNSSSLSIAIISPHLRQILNLQILWCMSSER